MQIGPFRSHRLVLREYEITDLECSHKLASDPDVVRHVTFDENDMAASRAFVTQAVAARDSDDRRTIRLVAELPGEGLIGDVVLYIGDARDRSAELGYFFRRDYWGLGYAPEAARAMINFGFEQLELNRIWSRCVVENPASARVMEKCCMTREGLLREHRFIKGRLADWLYYSILRREWEAEDRYLR